MAETCCLFSFAYLSFSLFQHLSFQKVISFDFNFTLIYLLPLIIMEHELNEKYDNSSTKLRG